MQNYPNFQPQMAPYQPMYGQPPMMQPQMPPYMDRLSQLQSMQQSMQQPWQVHRALRKRAVWTLSSHRLIPERLCCPHWIFSAASG